MEFAPQLAHSSDVPLYRQLYEQLALQIRSGKLQKGARLPATRELAGQLGLNRTTVSAAYEILEAEGLIAGQVGRGSFVTAAKAAHESGVDWSGLLERSDTKTSGSASSFPKEVVSFVMLRPSCYLISLDVFRVSCAAVLVSHDLDAFHPTYLLSRYKQGR